jgi:hypothetical protein
MLFSNSSYLLSLVFVGIYAPLDSSQMEWGGGRYLGCGLYTKNNSTLTYRPLSTFTTSLTALFLGTKQVRVPT